MSSEPLPAKYFTSLISNIYDVIKKLSALKFITKLYIEPNNQEATEIRDSKLELSKAQLSIYNQINRAITSKVYK